MVRSGIDPNALDGEPEVDPSLDWVFAAFWRLNTCRDIGMAAGRIPWTAIAAYADRAGINDPDDAEDFIDLILGLDDEYLKPKDKAGDDGPPAADPLPGL